MAKQGQYTFWVSRDMDKMSLKSLFAKMFGIHVTSIKTLKKGAESGRNVRGRKFTNLLSKKAIITIKDGEKMEIFEETKK